MKKKITNNLLLLALFLISINFSYGQDDDFTDGNFTVSPVWSGDTAVFSVLTDAILPGGTASTDGFFLGNNTSAGVKTLTTPSTETSEWRFSLGTTNFNPASGNSFGVILMSDTAISGSIFGTSWVGYYLKIGVNGGADRIELWRKNGAGTGTKVGQFSNPSVSSGISFGRNLRITRSASNVFELFYSASGFEYTTMPTTSGGTITDNSVSAVSTSSYFGVFTNFSSASRRMYIDNIEFGPVPVTTEVGFVSTTSTLAEDGFFIDVCVSIVNPDPLVATQVEIALDASSTAMNGTDYDDGAATPGAIMFPETITFPAGSSANQCMTIYISNDDSIEEPDETIVLFLQNASGGNLAQIAPTAASPFHTITILDNDALCPGGITTWEFNGTNFAWSNGVPDDTMHAIIDFAYTTLPGSPVGGQSIDACVLEIKSLGLVVTDGQYVRVVNNIINEASLTVQKGGSVVQVNDNATVSGVIGTFSVQIETTPLQDADRFTYFSSPTENSTLALFNSFAVANWEFNDTTQQWSYLGNSTASGNMQVGHGYAIQGGTGVTEIINFSGKFNNGEVLVPLSNDVYNDIDGDGLGGDMDIDGVIIPGSDPFPDPAATDDDSNFVGNPYPSAISVDDLIGSNLINAVYIWTHDSAVGTTQANPWIDNDYIECVIGTCTDLNNGGNTTSTYNGFIASGQGFFVTATASSDLTFNNSMRRTGNNDQFRSPNLNDEKLWLDFSTPQGYNKQIALTFTVNGTSGFDNKYEAKTIGNSYGLGFYSFNDLNDKLSINNSGILEDERVIPLGFYINSTIIDNATISINHFENLENVNIYLKDNLLNTLHDLKVNDYQLPITQIGEVNDRFEIVFNRTALSADNEIIANNTFVVSNNNETQINVNMLDGNIITNIKAFDILGKLVIDMKPNANDFVINTNVKQGQLLFFKATLENGQVLSNKFMKL